MKNIFDTSSLPLLTQFTLEQLLEKELTPQQVSQRIHSRKANKKNKEAAYFGLALATYRVIETYYNNSEDIV